MFHPSKKWAKRVGPCFEDETTGENEIRDTSRLESLQSIYIYAAPLRFSELFDRGREAYDDYLSFIRSP